MSNILVINTTSSPSAQVDVYDESNILVNQIIVNVLVSTVTLTSLISSFDRPFPSFVTNLAEINRWLTECNLDFSLTFVKPTRTSQSYVKLPNTVDSNFTIGSSFTFGFLYTKNTNIVTIKPHAAITFSWGNFNYFIKFASQFVSEVNDY